MRQGMAPMLVGMILLIGSSAWAQNATATTNGKRGATMHALGTFEVKVMPADAPALAKEAGLATYTLEKTFSGDFEGTSKGEMLSGSTESTGAMVYVAIDRVTGKLKGRSGTFLLMHRATMLKSDPNSGQMEVAIVPHSGTDGLTGISGRLIIKIEGKQHHYDLEYELSESATK